MRLENKIAFITGGTSGIGKATLHRLIKEGAKVIFTGRKEDAGNAIAEETGAVFFKHDVADDKGYKKIAKRIKSEFGKLDIAFANAGTEIGDADIETVTVENWNNLISINLTGAMLTTQMAVNLMKDNPDGATNEWVVSKK